MSEMLFIERNRRKTPMRLGKLLGEGAAGRVHAIADSPDRAVKLYHSVAEAQSHEVKVALMLANVPDLPALAQDGATYPQIAWPEARVTDDIGRFRGFLMPAIDLGRSTSLVNLLQKSSRRREGISDYYGYRVLVAYNLASMFAELHRAGHHMIDMKPANLRVYPATGWIAVVDTDGFSVSGPDGRIAAEQVSDDYIAPESWQKASNKLGEPQDNFALAVIIFQLLNNGVHPFAGMPVDGAEHPTDIQTRILQGLYAYSAQGHDAVKPALVSIHKTFRRDTRHLFDRAFAPGHRRPGAQQWREHLAILLDQLTPCKANPNEHAHFGAGCGFCLYESRIANAAANAKPRPKPQPAPLAATHIAPSARHLVLGARPPGRRLNGKRPRVAGRPQPRRKGKASLRRLPGKRPFVLRASRRGLKRVAAIAVGLAMLPVLLNIEVIAEQLLPRQSGAMIDVSTPAAPVAQLHPYPAPVRYRIASPSNQPTLIDLRVGPGTDFPEVEHIPSHEYVTGLAETAARDGRTWIWVKRDDGGSGYVDSASLAALRDDLFGPAPASGNTDSGADASGGGGYAASEPAIRSGQAVPDAY